MILNIFTPLKYSMPSVSTCEVDWHATDPVCEPRTALFIQAFLVTQLLNKHRPMCVLNVNERPWRPDASSTTLFWQVPSKVESELWIWFPLPMKAILPWIDPTAGRHPVMLVIYFCVSLRFALTGMKVFEIGCAYIRDQNLTILRAQLCVSRVWKCVIGAFTVLIITAWNRMGIYKPWWWSRWWNEITIIKKVQVLASHWEKQQHTWLKVGLLWSLEQRSPCRHAPILK